MKTWIVSIIVVVLSISIIALIFPSGKLGSYVKSIFVFVLTFVLLKPITEIKNQDVNISFDNFEVAYQVEYLDYIGKYKINKMVENCELIANNLGVNGITVKLEYELLDYAEIQVNKVELNLENTVINSDKEHIVIIEKVKKTIADYLGIDNSKVVTYGN